MRKLKILILGLGLVLVVALAVTGCGQTTSSVDSKETAKEPAPVAAPAVTQISTSPTQAGATYVGEKTCLQCHQKTNFDKTAHVNSFKPLSEYKLDKTYGAVAVYDGANKNAKSTTIDLSKALGVQMDHYVVAEIPKDAGFAKQFYRVGKLVENSDGTFKIDSASLVEGTQNWSAGDYSCATCHSPAMGKPGTPDNTVTCEACHGPGGNHVQVTTATDKKATITLPNSDTCLNCHNADPTKDKTGAIVTDNHHGPRNWTFSPMNSGQLNGCLTCHKVHGPDANGGLLRKDNPNDLCMQCHADKKYDVDTVMFQNASDPHGHVTPDHSFGAIPESALKLNPTTKNMEIVDPKALDLVKKKLPDLFK